MTQNQPVRGTNGLGYSSEDKFEIYADFLKRVSRAVPPADDDDENVGDVVDKTVNGLPRD